MEDKRIGYIKYIIETACFNLVWFRWHLGADINIFDSWDGIHINDLKIKIK